MRKSLRAVSALPALLAVVLFCGISLPVFAAGDDKPATPSSSSARHDREKIVFTNDDIDRMWPKQAQAGALLISQSGTATPQPLPRSTAASRVAPLPIDPEKDPLRYAEQIESLSAELDNVSTREGNLRAFRSTGAGTGVRIGLQIYAPCEGITTDNAIAQLAIRRREIQQQIGALESTARQNGMPPGIFQAAPEILQRAQVPLSPEQLRAALKDRQSELLGELDGVHSELSGMSYQAAAQGTGLLPPTPGWGGNMTTNLIEELDSRAGQLKAALAENEETARQAGLAPSALP